MDTIKNENRTFCDEMALVTNMDKYLGNVLDIVIDTASYGDFKIADMAGHFKGGLSVTDHATGKSVLLHLDTATLLGDALCTLYKDADGLWLNVLNPWDYENITIGTGGDYQGAFRLEGKWAHNVTVVENGRFSSDKDAVVDGLVINAGSAIVTVANTTVTNAVLNNGKFNLNADGHVTDIVVNGGHLVLGDGTLDGAFIGADGRMEIELASRRPNLKGTITVQGGVYLPDNYAPIETDAHFVFDLEGRNANSDSYFLSEGTAFIGNTSYTIQAAEQQKTGSYSITRISTSSPIFETFSITLTTANGLALGDLTIDGDAIRDNGLEYKLYSQNSDIYLDVNTIVEPYAVTVQTQEWEGADGIYIIEYSRDDFQTAVRASVASTAVDSYGMPSGDYRWRVRPQDSDEWTANGTLAVKDEIDNEPKHIVSNDNAITDVFFAKPRGTWNGGFEARHLGSMNGWQGTNEAVSLRNKNKLADIVEGSDDANILLMTDDANGDALFVDDIYSALPGDIDEQQSRLAKIDEIRAGAGDDIVDLTSQEFAYAGGGMTVRGGLGDDVVWANNGNNWLFGDAGNDRLVGAAGNDVIIGGAGNDSLHGGGGNDIIAFGGDWGQDTVEQLANGKVTLWFDNGDDSKWDAATLTYQDGDKSVHVSGVTAKDVTLKFGDDGSGKYTDLLSAGAFAEFTSEKIFEDRNRGMLA